MAVKLSDLIKSFEDTNVSGDFSEWVDKLELVAKLQKVKDPETFLPLFLSGPAFAVYKGLPEETKGDYDRLKEELVTAFGVSNYAAYEQLKSRVLCEGEQVDVYLADLRRLMKLIDPRCGEELLKCAFMSGLPGEVATQLKAMSSVEKFSLAELVARARMILSTRSESAFCVAAVQASSKKCFHCDGVGHMRRDCPKLRGRGPQCYSCQQMGHIARYCPKKQGNEMRGASAPGAPLDRD